MSRSRCIFPIISSQPEGALPGTLWNVGVGAAPAGGGQTWPHALGRPWVSVRAHYGALPLMWLDGDRQRREIAVSQVPGRTDRGLKERRGGTSKGVAVCLCFSAIREASRGRYQGAPFGVPPPLKKGRSTKSPTRAAARERGRLAV